MANRAEASDEGVHKEYTKLQVALLNNLADHRRIYLKQCNLACDMLNYHPIDRPRCDDILTELDTIMDEGLYDSAHRNDHRENIVAQLSHVFEATNLDSAEAVPSLLAQFDNSEYFSLCKLDNLCKLYNKTQNAVHSNTESTANYCNICHFVMLRKFNQN